MLEQRNLEGFLDEALRFSDSENTRLTKRIDALENLRHNPVTA